MRFAHLSWLWVHACETFGLLLLIAYPEAYPQPRGSGPNESKRLLVILVALGVLVLFGIIPMNNLLI